MTARPMRLPLAVIDVCVLLAAVLLAGCGEADDETVTATPSAIPDMSFDQAVDKLVADGYPQQQNEYLNGLGSSDLGFRITGTEAEKQAAQHIADELTAMGLSNVRLEKVPVDAWDFKGASVSVGDRDMTASSFAGATGTPAEGITGDVVYLGAGSKDDYDEAGDVTGKIVLIDTIFEEYRINLQCGEATQRGATAVISTYGPTSSPWYQVDAKALGSNDAEYDRSFVPVVYIARTDGDALKKQLKAGKVEATVKSDITITMAEDGGTGYNVVAELPGRAANGEMVVIGGHHDAHFRAGADDTGAVSATLTLAKAMTMSGYTPKRTIVFFFDTAEEYGYTDCYFDWIIGAWYAITHEHADWPGKAVAYINLEAMAEKGGSVGAAAPAELAPYVKKQSTAAVSGLPGGAYVDDKVSPYSNGWTFTAAGVPTITLMATKDDYWKKYHTDHEVDANIDWQVLGSIVKYTAKLQAGLDEGAPPYSLSAGAAYVAKGVKVAELKAAGADSAAIMRLKGAATAYASAARAADARVAAMTPEQQAAVSGDLMALEKTYCNGLLALSAWEEQILPHQQVAYDTAMLQATLAALKAGKKDAALESLIEVSNTWNAVFVDQEVYEQDNARWAPDYEKLTWGAQSHLPPLLNVWPQCELIQKGKLSQAADQLQPTYESTVTTLNERVNEVADVLEQLTSQAEALQ